MGLLPKREDAALDYIFLAQVSTLKDRLGQEPS